MFIKLSSNRIYICPSPSLDLTFLQILNQHVKKYAFKIASQASSSSIKSNSSPNFSLIKATVSSTSSTHSEFGCNFRFEFSVTCSMCITRSTIFFHTERQQLRLAGSSSPQRISAISIPTLVLSSTPNSSPNFRRESLDPMKTDPALL